MKRLSCLFMLASLALQPAAAQDKVEEPVELYQVEVLLFRHLDQSRTTTEIPRLVEPQIEDVLDQQLPRLTSAVATPAAPVAVPEQQPLEDSGLFMEQETPQIWSPVTGELQMAEDAQRLERLEAYELLHHLAWIQPAPDVSIAEAIDAAEIGAAPEVIGNFKLYRKRYLHLAVDVALEETSPENRLQQFPPTDDSNPAIVDSRRMRLGRTVYFDQPRFGVLATVTKVQTPEDDGA